MRSRRLAIVLVNLLILTVLLGSGRIITQHSALAETRALFIPDDSVVYQGRLTGFSVRQTGSGLLVSASSRESVALVKTRTQVLSGAEVTVSVPAFQYQAKLSETSSGLYQVPVQLDVTLTPSVDGGQVAVADISQWSLTPQAATFSLGSSSVSASNLGPITIAGALAKVDLLAQSLAGLPSVNGFIAGAGIRAQAAGQTYEVPVTLALQGQVRDGAGKAVANRRLSVNVAPGGLAAQSFGITTDEAGGFSYDVTYPAVITVSGGSLANLATTFQMQGVTTEQVSAFWWGGVDVGPPGFWRTGFNLGLPFDSNAAGGSDPINILTGNMYDVETDVSYAAPGLPVSFGRTYNSQDSSVGVLGRGWTSTLGLKVEQSQHDGTASLTETTAQGSRVIWTAQGQSGDFTPPAGVHGSMHLDQGDKTTTKRDKYGLLTHFLNGDQGGLVDWVRDPNGNQLGFAYSGGQLASLTDAAGRVMRFSYTAAGRLASVTDPLGNAIAYAYDAQGGLAEVSFPGGSKVGYSYDSSGNLAQITDPNGFHRLFTYDAQNRATSFSYDGGLERTTFRYDPAHNQTTLTDAQGFQTVYSYQYVGSAGLITRIVDPMGATSRFEFDADGNRITVVDPLGSTTKLTYDGQANLTSVTDAGGAVARTTFEATYNRPTTFTDPLARVTNLGYDGRGNLTSLTDPLGGVSRLSVDGRGLVSAQTDPQGATSRIGYDAAGNAVSRTDPLGNQTQAGYDDLGRMTSTADALGTVTKMAYDGQHRLTRMTRADGSTVSVGYDLSGNVTSLTDPLGHVTSFSYDQANHALKSVDALQRATTMGYNVRGHAASVTDGAGSTTLVTYDPAGNPAKLVRADGSFALLQHDPAGRLTSFTDPNGNISRYRYDPVGRLTEVTDPLGGVTSYSFDKLGQPVAVTDPNGHRTSSGYDQLGRKTSSTDALGRTWKYGYDAVGNLVTVSDALGTTATYAYDALGRPLKAVYADGQTVAAEYDPAGHLRKLVDGLGATSFSYDSLNQLVRESHPDGVTLLSTYDGAGNRTSLTTPAGTTAYAYDAANQLARVTDPVKGVAGFQYDGAGRVTSQTLPNGAFTSAQYDLLGRVTKLVNSALGGAPDQFAYSYDRNGNVVGQTRNRAQTLFSYDAGNRLTRVSAASGAGIEYSYDGAGNRLAQRTTGVVEKGESEGRGRDELRNGAINYSYDAADQLLSAGPVRYAYDADGQLLSAASLETKPTTYSWDARHLLSAVQSEEGKVAYSYDGMGRMVGRQAGESNPLQSVYDGLQLVAQRERQTTPRDGEQDPPQWTGYVNGNGQALSTHRSSGDERPEQRFFQYDRLGSLTGVSNRAGRIESRLGYSAWGTPLGKAGAGALGEDSGDGEGGDQNGFRSVSYIGQPHDLNTGLGYFNARWYSPQMGRFLSGDPAAAISGVPGTLNRYAYSLNNPITLSDPSGLMARQIAALVIGTAVGIVLAAACTALTAGVGAVLCLMGAGAVGSMVSYAIATPQSQWSLSGFAVAGAIGAGTALAGFGLGWVAGKVLTRAFAQGASRLARDVAVNPMAPPALSLARSIGGPAANRAVQADIRSLVARGARDIRLNQQQVNVNGVRVGINRPDLQYTLGGVRHYVEYDTVASGRGAAHASRLLANDPSAVVTLVTVP